MATTVQTFILQGVTAIPVTVEVDLVNRLPRMAIVGLATNAAQEACERIRSAITAAGFEFPRKRIIVNLSPADLRKDGTSMDLAIAVGILVASQQLHTDALEKAYYGELALDGSVRPVRGALAVRKVAGERLVVSMDLYKLVTLVGPTFTICNLSDTRGPRQAGPGFVLTHQPLPPTSASGGVALDYADVRGNLSAIDGLVQAARTGVPLILVGPPGCGKSMLARRFTGLLPDLTWEERLEVTTIHEAVGLMGDSSPVPERPFRAPHHTVTSAGLIGDKRLRPGEGTLAHKGVLFLDEAAEFPKATLDLVLAMHKLQECRRLPDTLAPLSERVILPAAFHLILAVNDAAELGRLRVRFPQLPPESVVVRLETVAGMDLLNGPKWPTTAELRAQVQA